MKKVLSRKTPELLAPAGSPDSLMAAIEGGADAVYFGALEFSGRMRAENFDSKGLADAVRLCRIYSVSSHIAVNTRLRDRELPRALALAEELYRLGADAFIVADPGLASLIRERMDVSLHASTQLSGASPLDAEILASLGFDRMICPRELTERELRELAAASPIEIEAFVHGAHCVSVSGQCLMSWAMGGRSGNRGCCAQPCRLPYRRSGSGGRRSRPSAAPEYPLSLKDMCLAAHIPALIDSGVASLKIEGRLKGPDYVYGVTRIYRRLLDERRAATPDEIHELELLFSRDGFTDGYFTGRLDRMGGTRTVSDERSVVRFTSLTRKVNVKARLVLDEGRPAELTLSDFSGRSVTVLGEAPEAARTSPLTDDALFQNLSRLGSTPFSLDRSDAETAVHGALWLPPAQINALRRDAARALEEKIASSGERTLSDAPAARRRADNKADSAPESALTAMAPDGVVRLACFRSAEQVPEGARDFFDAIFVPYYRRGSSSDLMTELPPFAPDDGESERILSRFADGGGRLVMVSTLSQLALSVRLGLVPVASFRFNVTNAAAADELLKLGARVVTLSPELPSAAMSAVSRGTAHGMTAAIVYGRLPLMLLRRCVIGSGCAGEASDSVGRCGRAGGFASCRGSSLVDRMGEAFPVFPAPGCMNEIMNSRPIWNADRSGPDVGAQIFLFTDEDRRAAADVIAAYRDRLPPPGNAKRI